MLKTLLVLLATAGVVSADVRTYDVHATRHENKDFSCQATSRMMRDRHTIKIYDDGTVRINGFRWKVEREEPNLLISFHDASDHGNLVYLEMDLYVSMRGLSGKYILYGTDVADNKRREPCYDVVYVDGTAR